ncbi:MAG: hypothetical protein HQL87_14230 [Magnetococcales bacterium]|nr:hypothetical protein [Magnetococcales bacterium]
MRSISTPHQPAVMTQEGFRRLAAPILSELHQMKDLSADVVTVIMESMVEEGVLGLDEHGLLAARRVDPGKRPMGYPAYTAL